MPAGSGFHRKRRFLSRLPTVGGPLGTEPSFSGGYSSVSRHPCVRPSPANEGRATGAWPGSVIGRAEQWRRRLTAQGRRRCNDHVDREAVFTTYLLMGRAAARHRAAAFPMRRGLPGRERSLRRRIFCIPETARDSGDYSIFAPARELRCPSSARTSIRGGARSASTPIFAKAGVAATAIVAVSNDFNDGPLALGAPAPCVRLAPPFPSGEGREAQEVGQGAPKCGGADDRRRRYPRSTGPGRPRGGPGAARAVPGVLALGRPAGSSMAAQRAPRTIRGPGGGRWSLTRGRMMSMSAAGSTPVSGCRRPGGRTRGGQDRAPDSSRRRFGEVTYGTG